MYAYPIYEKSSFLSPTFSCNLNHWVFAVFILEGLSSEFTYLARFFNASSYYFSAFDNHGPGLEKAKHWRVDVLWHWLVLGFTG